MNSARFNQHVAAGRQKAEKNLPALERGYRITLQAAARHAADRFTALATNHLAADASDPKWTPPQNDQLVDPDAMAADARKRTKAAHQAALKRIIAPPLADIGIAYDVTNPLVAALAGSVGMRAQDLSDAVQGDLASAVLDAYQQGLSVAAAAKAIQAAVEGVAPGRAAMLARTDLVGLANGASLAAAQLVSGDDSESGGLGYKQWLATEDERTRETHAEADGQIVPVEQPFSVGGEQAMYPGDPDLSDAEACNCRCTLVYLDASEVGGGDVTAGASPTGAVRSPGRMTESLHDPLTADVTITVADDADTGEAAAAPVRWRAVLCVEGEQTEDGRMLEDGSISWRELPLSLGAMFETPHSYDAAAPICGRIDTIWRDGNQIMGEGVFNADEVGVQAAEMVANLSLRGISVDLGILAYELREANPPVATDETDDAPDAEPDIADVITEIDNLLFVVTEGVIGAATICPYQAIAGATIAIVATAGGDSETATVSRDTCFVLTAASQRPSDAPLDPRVAESLAKLEQATRPERMREYQLGMETGIYTLNDCLRAEGRPTVEGGDDRAMPLPVATQTRILDQLAALSQTSEALAAALERAAAHEEQTQALVASIDKLTDRVAAGERVDGAMIETLRSLAGPRSVQIVRDESGRMAGLEGK